MKKSVLINFVLLLPLTYSHAPLAGTESDGDALLKLLAIAPFAYSLYRQDADGLLQYTFGALSTQGLTSVGKRTTGKRRPNGNCCDAFPSGHTSAAFHSPFFIAERYPYLEASPYFAAAALMAYSRIQADKHDLTDIAAGAGLAFLVNHYFTGNQADDSRPRIGVYTRDDGGISFVFDWRW